MRGYDRTRGSAPHRSGLYNSRCLLWKGFPDPPRAQGRPSSGPPVPPVLRSCPHTVQLTLGCNLVSLPVAPTPHTGSPRVRVRGRVLLRLGNAHQLAGPQRAGAGGRLTGVCICWVAVQEPCAPSGSVTFLTLGPQASSRVSCFGFLVGLGGPSGLFQLKGLLRRRPLPEAGCPSPDPGCALQHTAPPLDRPQASPGSGRGLVLVTLKCQPRPLRSAQTDCSINQ